MSRTSSSDLPAWAFWIFLVRGSVALVLGLVLLVWGAGLSRLSTFVAVYWLIGALLTLRWVAENRAASDRPAGVVAGVIGLVAAVAVIARHPLNSLIAQGLLLDLLGLSVIGMGILRLSGGFHDDQLARDRARGRYRVIVGALDIVLGVALVVADDRSAFAIRFALVVWGVLAGTFLLLDALWLRRPGVSHPRREA